jgi:hypothetical protein
MHGLGRPPRGVSQSGLLVAMPGAYHYARWLQRTHVGVICLIIAIIVIVDHGLNPLRAPLMPLLATLGASLVVSDFSIEWCHVAVAWSRLPTVWDREELGCLLAGAVLGGYVVHLLGGVPKNVVRRLEMQRLLCVTHIAFGCFRP